MLSLEGDKFLNKYRIPSARLKEFDYSTDGAYFVTICTYDRICCFGNIINNKIKLNNLGMIAKNIWLMIPKYFSFVTLDKFVIMPNHVHGIVVIEKDWVRRHECRRDCRYDCRDAINRVSTPVASISMSRGGITKNHNPMLNKFSLPKIIRWFKGRTTFEIKNKFDNKDFEWQTRYYDKIIWNERAFWNIRQYIFDNPQNWADDRNNIFGQYPPLPRLRRTK